MQKLSKKDELKLFEILNSEVEDSKKQRAREKLILSHDWLVSFVINKWYRKIPKFLYEDMKQVGLIGVNIAIDKFNLDKNVRFATYATWWIRQQINQFLVDSGRTVRAPAYVIDAASKISKARDNFESEHGRIGTDEEIAERIEIPIEKFGRYEQAVQHCASLEFTVGEDTQLMDLLQDSFAEDPADTYMQKNLKNKLSDVLIRILEPREEFIIRMRFGMGINDDQTLEAIGSKLKLTKERIRQIERDALNKLKNSQILKEFVENNFHITSE